MPAAQGRELTKVKTNSHKIHQDLVPTPYKMYAECGSKGWTLFVHRKELCVPLMYSQFVVYKSLEFNFRYGDGPTKKEQTHTNSI